MNGLKMQLNELWAGTIESLNVDLLKGTIALRIKVVKNEIVSNYELTFYEVSAHYFIKNSGESRLKDFQFDEGDYLELTSIDYFAMGIGDITIRSKTNNWVNQYFSSANFALEIWSSMFFIEAKKVAINGAVFDA
ncbi:hypothetical protein D3C87_1015530 [compost metagenome]